MTKYSLPLVINPAFNIQKIPAMGSLITTRKVQKGNWSTGEPEAGISPQLASRYDF
jgi:hypothetical protein